jgi:site-specific DNA recombinase
MPSAPHVPRNAISLTRISDADVDPETGELVTDGVDDQERNQQAWAGHHGWRIGLSIKSPKLTAYKRRKKVMPDGTEVWRVWRPDLQRALRLLWNGVHDGLIVTDLDRYARDPYDLQDLIALVEARRGRVRVGSITGSLDLDTDAGIAMAEVMMSMARKSSKDTARRVSAARTRNALAGKHGGGRRPYGFGAPVFDVTGAVVLDPRTGRQALDYLAVIPEEAAEIVKASKAVLAGISLRACVRDLREREVPTVTGRPWSTETLHDILMRPRNAGLMVNRGEVVGAAPWPPIVPEDTWRAVVTRLNNPDRNTGPGPEPKWLGSGIYRCVCGGPMQVSVRRNADDRPRYRCDHDRPGPHASRDLARTDEWVETVLLGRLSQPDGAELVVAGAAAGGVDVGALRARAAELRQNRSDLAAAKAVGAISQADLLRGSRIISDELASIEAALTSDSSESLLKPLVEAGGMEAAQVVWSKMPLGVRREILKRVLTVKILPLGKGGRFTEEAILITAADDSA